jgi:hypothetical protein
LATSDRRGTGPPIDWAEISQPSLARMHGARGLEHNRAALREALFDIGWRVQPHDFFA